MSCKSAILTVNKNVNVPVNGAIPLGSVLRRFGQNLKLEGNGIVVQGQGYYELGVSVTATAAVAGPLTVTVLKDGVELSGATATETAAANGTVNLCVQYIVREQCCDSSSALTFVLTGGTALVNNIAVTAVKL